MKPILLKISGLNSYIEEQQVDFEQFRAYGTFGIFGPTGAGKSTILDALTIALFGPKAMSRGTNDFINAACDKARVYLKFEGGKGNFAGVYTIERGFKRKKNSDGKSDGITTEHLRLHRIDQDGNENVWERQSEVQSQMIGCLGMDHDDFLRSVILPQGKFSEFLGLKGKDRRDMLERLMGLEAYGDQLRNKVARVKSQLDKEHEYLKGQLNQLTNYTEEALNLIVLEAKTVGETCEHKIQALELQKESTRLIETKRESTMKLELAEAEQKQLEAEASVITQVRFQLESAKKVQPMALIEESIATLEKTLNERYDAWLSGVKKVVHEPCDSITHYLDALRMQTQALALEVQRNELETSKCEQALDTWMLPKEFSPLMAALNEFVAEYQSNKKELTQLQMALEETHLKQVDNHLKRQHAFDSSQRLILQGQHLLKGLESKIDDLDKSIETNTSNLETLQREQAASWLQSHLYTREDCPVCHRPITQDERIQIEKGIQNETVGSDIENQLHNRRQVIDRQRDEKTSILQLKISCELMLNQLKNEAEAYKIETFHAPLERNDVQQERADVQPEVEEVNFETWKKDVNNWSEEWKNQSNASKQLLLLRETQAQGVSERQKNTETFIQKVQHQLSEIEITLGKRIDGIEKPLTYKTLKAWIEDHEGQTQKLRHALTEARKQKEIANDKRDRLSQNMQMLETEGLLIQQSKNELNGLLTKRLGFVQTHFDGEIEVYLKALKEVQWIPEYEAQIQTYELRRLQVSAKLEGLSNTLGIERVTAQQLSEAQQHLTELETQLQALHQELAVLNSRAIQWEEGLKSRTSVQKEMQTLEKRLNHVIDIANLLRGNRFIDFIAAKSLKVMTREASDRLSTMTGGRYAIETAADGSFVIRDFYHGGELRDASSLSGGETFVTSLALALALSSHFQLKGKTKLDFFVLDEGFGSLDKALLETVMNALDHLKHQNLLIGIVSHVEEIKQRIPVRLDVLPAIKGVKGSEIKVVWL